MDMGLKKACFALLLAAGLNIGVAAQETTMAAATPAATAAPALPPTTDPREIVRRSVEIDHHNYERAQNYTAQQREVEKDFDKHGGVKAQHVRTYDLTFYYGEPYSRLMQKDDRPLSEKDQKKEDEKLDKFINKYKNESEAERQKRQAKQKKEREEERGFLRDVVNAYDFKLVGDETLDGHDVYVIEATPRKDFHPTKPHADILPKIKGKLWIEKQEYNWVKVEAESIDTISFGLFLARIHKGSRFVLEQVHVNDEVWLVRRFYVNGGVRIALLKNMAAEQEDIFSNFKKFSSGTRILPGVREVETSPEPK